jgi:hypothetical protein
VVAQHAQVPRDLPDSTKACSTMTLTPTAADPAFARIPRIRRRTGSPRQSNAGMNRLSHHAVL